MNGLTGLMDKENEKFPSGSKVFAHSGDYVNYITMEIITDELIRNVGLALICVFFATMFLLAHLLIREKPKSSAWMLKNKQTILLTFR